MMNEKTLKFPQLQKNLEKAQEKLNQGLTKGKDWLTGAKDKTIELYDGAKIKVSELREGAGNKREQMMESLAEADWKEFQDKARKIVQKPGMMGVTAAGVGFFLPQVASALIIFTAVEAFYQPASDAERTKEEIEEEEQKRAAVNLGTLAGVAVRYGRIFDNFIPMAILSAIFAIVLETRRTEKDSEGKEEEPTSDDSETKEESSNDD